MEGQTAVLWASNSTAGKLFETLSIIIIMFKAGWNHGISYRFHIRHIPDQDLIHILHIPDQDLIHIRVWEGEELVVDTGDIRDEAEESLRGGRLGVFCDSQEGITWSALQYRCV